MKIVVLAGGTSTEREISIVSGTGICGALRQKGHEAILVDIFCGVENVDWENPFPAEYDVEKAAEYMSSFNPQIKEMEKKRRSFFGPNVLELCEKCDIVFLGLHGANGEDGKVQAAFDLMGIRYTGTGYLSSAISMSKELTKKVLVSEGVPMPKGISLKKGHKIEYVPYPCVVKPCCGGSSVGVSIANNEEEFRAAVEEAFRYEDNILVEEYVKGREFSVAVLDGEALPVIEIEPLEGFYDYKNKYNGATKETCPANLPADVAQKMQRWAVKACQAVGIETCGRVDMLLNEDEDIFCLEINTLPGMTETSLIPQEAAAVGMSYDQLTQKIVEISMNKYNK